MNVGQETVNAWIDHAVKMLGGENIVFEPDNFGGLRVISGEKMISLPRPAGRLYEVRK